MSFPFQPPDLDPGQRAAVEAFRKAAYDVQITERRQLLYWAPIFCSCPAWWRAPGQDPPQAGCTVHGTVALLPDGRWM